MHDTHWLRRPVVVGLAALLVALYALAWGTRTWELARSGWVDANGLPFGGDFVAFWSGGRLALEGRAIEAFDPEVIFAVQASALPEHRARFLWNYPPTFHLLVAPLGMLGMVAACWTWWSVTVPLYLAALGRVVPRPETPLVAMAGSGVLLTLAHGQNGFLLTAIYVGGLELVRRGAPVWGGLLLGCLAVKPHLAVLLPIALGVARSWRAFVATGVSLGVWVAVSTGAFGVRYWSAFAQNLDTVRVAIDAGELPAGKLVSPYVLALSLGAPTTVATGVQTLTAVGCALVVGWAFRGGVTHAACALLLVASCLPSPYLFDYDLVLLSGAGAFAVADGLERGFLAGDRELWLVAALAPIVLAPAYGALGVQLGPVLVVALLVATARAVRRSG
jgi:hypothetical protein